MLDRFPGILVALAVLSSTGCGGSGDADPEPVLPPRVPAITTEQANAIAAGTPQRKVLARLGRPVLRQRPTAPDFPGGCIFYPMQRTPITSTWQICFDRKGVKLVATALTDQTAVPDGSSQQRGALIGRADTICLAGYARLRPITRAVGQALKAFGRSDTPRTRAEVARAIGRFIGNLESTQAQLAAFMAPPDAGEAWDGYLAALDEQMSVLRRARDAFGDRDDEEYERLGERFDELAATAKEQARDFGLQSCSASTFG